MTDPTPATPIAAPVAPILAADPAPAPAPAPVDPAPAPVDPAPAPAAGDPPADPAPVTWPENWRELKANGDEKMLKRLQRYSSPSAAIDALFEAQTRISKGDLLPSLKENATPEEISDYRVAHGIPAEPAGYEINLPNGLVIGEADRPMVDEFLTKAHASNMHPAQVNEALGWYFDRADQARIAQEARDTESRMATEDELRAEFGPDYRVNVKIAKSGTNSIASSPGKGSLTGTSVASVVTGPSIFSVPSLSRWTRV